jgi:hypothetical protein
MYFIAMIVTKVMTVMDTHLIIVFDLGSSM